MVHISSEFAVSSARIALSGPEKDGNRIPLGTMRSQCYPDGSGRFGAGHWAGHWAGLGWPILGPIHGARHVDYYSPIARLEWVKGPAVWPTSLYTQHKVRGKKS